MLETLIWASFLGDSKSDWKMLQPKYVFCLSVPPFSFVVSLFTFRLQIFTGAESAHEMGYLHGEHGGDKELVHELMEFQDGIYGDLGKH